MISAVLVIHNEEQLIERALKSCAGVASEIIVIHDGPCADRSLEIARRYTDRIFVRPRIGEAEPHRVFGFQQARYLWVLQIDADEFLSPKLRTHLPELVKDQRYTGYEFLWPTWYKGRYYYAYYKRALVRKDQFYFIGSPHEYPKAINPTVQVKRVKYVLEHKPLYDNLTLHTFRSKWIPWTRIHADYYIKDFATLEKYNCDLSDWEPTLRYRLRHPLLLGILASWLFHVGLGVKNALSRRQWIFFKSGLLMGFYHAFVFFYVWRKQT